MVFCFPSFLLLVSCCPDPTALSPEEAGCPKQYLAMRDQCCNKAIVDAVFRQLGTLEPADVAYALPFEGRPYLKVLSSFVDITASYLRDSDVLNVNAWRLYSIASIRLAISAVDDIKDRFAQILTTQDAWNLIRDAVRCTRELTRALFRTENFHAFLMSDESNKYQEILQDFEPHRIQDFFAPSLKLYEEGAMVHNYLAYSLMPSLEQMSQRLSKQRKGTFPVAGPLLNSTALEGSAVNLLVVSLGDWAKTGFLTLWSILSYRSTRLRIFVLGDEAGLRNWKLAVEELEQTKASQTRLQGVVFEYIDFASKPLFQSFLANYPKDCSFGASGHAILARVVCHLVLPPDVDRVISTDLGDVIFLEDVKQLWDLGDDMKEHHMLAASHAVALSHINAGVALYNVARMRQQNFEETALQAVRDGLKRSSDRDCFRDQSIINVLHSFRQEFSYEGPSPVMILPCRWSVFPASEWQQGWNSPEFWLESVRQRKRYPGIISLNRVELFCPDQMDLLSSWAFIPMSTSEDQSRQARLRTYSHYEGKKEKRYCSQQRQKKKCCSCGEPAALLHVAGDMKSWPTMRGLLRAYLPPWKDGPPDEAFARSDSTSWWGGAERAQRMREGTIRDAIAVAKQQGIQSVFNNCMTLRTQASDMSFLDYASVKLGRLSLPLRIEVETTAVKNANVLIGVGSQQGLELEIGHDIQVQNYFGQKAACLRWVRSQPKTVGANGWTARQELMCVEHMPAMVREGEELWANYSITLGADKVMTVGYGHDGTEWGNAIPEESYEILSSAAKARRLLVSVGTLGENAKWVVCKGDAT
mmetsp:Transcript_26574/g.48082  ORF Transcript_26574/g.48082 Transcript_26574/m.48082 type:complete len:813 (+) Transcript_26574:118-2556(+)